MKNLTTIITAIFLLTSITTAQNYSLSFDGNDDYVNVGNTSSLTISGDITVSAWVYFDDFSTILPNVISKVTDGSNVSYGIAKNLNESKLSFWIRSEEHTSELQSQAYLVCRLLLEKKKKNNLHARTTSLHPRVVFTE